MATPLVQLTIGLLILDQGFYHYLSIAFLILPLALQGASSNPKKKEKKKKESFSLSLMGIKIEISKNHKSYAHFFFCIYYWQVYQIEGIINYQLLTTFIVIVHEYSSIYVLIIPLNLYYYYNTNTILQISTTVTYKHINI